MAIDGASSINEQQLQKMKTASGFIAALDQSGGSTPKALRLYGMTPDAYCGIDEMFAVMHEMRTRIITSSSFRGDRILGAILFEDTIARQIDGREYASYLWSVKNIVPFLKVDHGLAEESDGVQLMKPIPDLDQLLDRAVKTGIFGTKMRSVIRLANSCGVEAIVAQQFETTAQVLATGLIPIIEPEIDIECPQKEEAELLLETALRDQLAPLATDQRVILKLTLPEVDNFYSTLVSHPNVVRVAALSGGYGRKEANARLARNHGVVASFSRALTEGLSVHQSDQDFYAALDESVASIFEASDT